MDFDKSRKVWDSARHGWMTAVVVEMATSASWGRGLRPRDDGHPILPLTRTGGLAQHDGVTNVAWSGAVLVLHCVSLTHPLFFKFKK